MKEIKVEDAIGQVLCHDVTEIIRGKTKGARFRKGHIITAEDIPILLRLGKENIFVWENDETKLHENDAAEILCKICQGAGLNASEVSEGKIELSAAYDGVFHVDENTLYKINDAGEICIATLKNKIPVRADKKVAGMRVIPLVIDKAKIDAVKNISGSEPLMKILPYKKFKVGLIVTGSEIFHGRIEDTFTPVIDAKLKTFGLQIDERRVSSDDKAMTKNFIDELLNLGMEMILCTGGMSVDPDDKTPAAIKATGAAVVTYGVPVLPGAMFMLAYKGYVPIIGLPGCVMYCAKTVFDLVLPRILTGETLTRKDFISMGVGGLI